MFFYYPMKGGLVSMNEATKQKTTAPVVREYEIGGITYIVKAVAKDGAKEDAATKIRRLIKTTLKGTKKARQRIIYILDADGERVLWYNTYNLFVRLPEQEVIYEAARQDDRILLSCGNKTDKFAP